MCNVRRNIILLLSNEPFVHDRHCFPFSTNAHTFLRSLLQRRLSCPEFWVPVDVRRGEHRTTNFKCQSCVLASIWCHSREHFQQHIFRGTVSAASVGFHSVCVSRHKARRRLPAKNAKSMAGNRCLTGDGMELKHCMLRKTRVPVCELPSYGTRHRC